MSMVLSFVNQYFTLMYHCVMFTCALYGFHSRSALYRKPLPHFLVTATLPLQLMYLHSAEDYRSGTTPLYHVGLKVRLCVFSVIDIRLTQYRSTPAVLVPL